MVNESVEKFDSSESDEEWDQNAEIKGILELALPDAYRQLLQHLRFDYVSFRNNGGSYDHHYSSCISSASQPSQSKLIRLA